MYKVSPNLTRTLSLTLDLVCALEKRDFDLALVIDEKRRLYCKKDTEFDDYDWIKFKLVKKIQEYLIEDLLKYKRQQEDESKIISRNLKSLRNSYLND